MKQIPAYTEIFSDDSIVVLNKRSSYLTAADRFDTDSPRLDELAEKTYGTLFAVHRLDKEASGLVLYARNSDVQKNILQQFDSHQALFTYHILANGHPLWNELHVSLLLQSDADARHRTLVNKRFGKTSITDYTLLGTCGPYSWIKAVPKTRCTHQVRVGLQQNGIYVVCDYLYSGNQKAVKLSDFKKKYNGDSEEEKALLNRLGMHSYSLEMKHPLSGEKIIFTAPYQKDMDATRKQLAKIFKVDPLEEN